LEWTFSSSSPGFLITGLLLDTRKAGNYFSGFYARRALRIFPLYYLVLIGVMLASWLLLRTHAPNAELLASQLPLPADRWVYFCYLTNWVALWKAPWDTNYLAHFWSLAVEEQFYLVWPMIVWLARPRAIRWIAVTLAASSEIIRLIWLAHSGPSITIVLATVTRMDALFIGAFCATLYRDPGVMQKIRGWLPWIAWACLGSWVLVFNSIIFFRRPTEALLFPHSALPIAPPDAMSIFSQYGGFSLLALGFGAWVLLCAHADGQPTIQQKLLRSRLLGKIGLYSYGIYVFHVPLLGFMEAYVFAPLSDRNQPGPLLGLTCLALLAIVTFFVSALSYELFERKFLNYKPNFSPRFAAQPPRRKLETALAPSPGD